MARRVFFSFHYDRDIVRVSQVRNSWVTRDREIAGFWDAASWESVKRAGDVAIKQWIESQLAGTSVTIVLIGAQTAQRKYVLHEIQRSLELGKGLLGVRIHGLKDFSGRTDDAGHNPFEQFTTRGYYGQDILLSQVVAVHDYAAENGYVNMDAWIEAAARAAGR